MYFLLILSPIFLKIINSVIPDCLIQVVEKAEAVRADELKAKEKIIEVNPEFKDLFIGEKAQIVTIF